MKNLQHTQGQMERIHSKLVEQSIVEEQSCFILKQQSYYICQRGQDLMFNHDSSFLCTRGQAPMEEDKRKSD